MDAMRIAGFAIAGGITALLLRRMNPGMGLAAALSAGVLLLLAVLPPLSRIIQALSGIARTGGVDGDYLLQLMKIAGISLLMDFAAQTCRDAGEDSLAMKTELAGRVMLLTIALPSMQSLLARILALSP